MKKIIIVKENGESLITHDNDDSDILEYSSKLSELMNASHISILETSEKILIVRPNKIEAIEVSEVEIKNIKPIQPVKEHIDIITDRIG